MECSCRVPVCVLFFLTASALAASRSVKVKLHETATLSCDHTCSGVVEWIGGTTVVAQCSDTQCSAVEGYEASRGVDSDDLSVSAVTYRQRGWYTSRCNDQDYCDVQLIIQAVTSSVRLTAGEDLVMDLPVPGPVEVIYKAKDSSDVYGVQICTATQHSLHCNSEYTPRTTFSFPHITLTHTTLSDGGVYFIHDSDNQELLHIYTLEIQPESQCDQVHVKKMVVLVVLLFGVILLVSITVCVYVCRRWVPNKMDRTMMMRAPTKETMMMMRAPTKETMMMMSAPTKETMMMKESQLLKLSSEMAEAAEIMEKINTLINNHQIHPPITSHLSYSIRPTRQEVLEKQQKMEEILDSLGQWWTRTSPKLDQIIAECSSTHTTDYKLQLQRHWEMLDVDSCDHTAPRTPPSIRSGDLGGGEG